MVALTNAVAARTHFVDHTSVLNRSSVGVRGNVILDHINLVVAYRSSVVKLAEMSRQSRTQAPAVWVTISQLR